MYHATSQEHVDAALMERLDAMAEHHRKTAETRGEIWVSGYIPSDTRCGDVAERGAQHDDTVAPQDGD